jgi:hypothetical protein
LHRKAVNEYVTKSWNAEFNGFSGVHIEKCISGVFGLVLLRNRAVVNGKRGIAAVHGECSPFRRGEVSPQWGKTLAGHQGDRDEA